MSEALYIVRDDPRFPARLRPVKPTITGLWYRGSWELLENNRMAAIVGSRKMSRYGKQVLQELVPQLVQARWITVSGYMYGIDVEVARLTLQNGGKHVAVVGCGIERENEIEEIGMYHKLIVKDGLVISELAGEMRGQVFTFPRRNRVVVGLSEMVIVIEAGEKSGSLNSASWGRRMGKRVYAVPGSIFSGTSNGTNELIELGLAKALTWEEIKKLGKDNNYSKFGRIDGNKISLTKKERTLLTLLKKSGPKQINGLARELEIPVNEVMEILTAMAVNSLVSEERGVWRVELRK